MIKRELLFCFHSYYLLKNYILDIKNLTNDFEITIIISNHLIENNNLVLDEIKKKINVKNVYIIPFYSKNDERSLLSILLTHLNLKILKKKISFKEFEVCVSDAKYFVWTRIILEELLSEHCKKIGVVTGSIALNLEIFKKILQGDKIEKYINQIHKLREYKQIKRKKEKNFYKKFLNIKKRIYDNYIDRKILSYIFYARNFNYKKFDLNLLETDQFDKKIVFHYSNYLFWNHWYRNKNVVLCRHENKCTCKENNKKKAIFLSSMMKENKIDLSKQIDNVYGFFNKKIRNEIDIRELHIKHHPSEPNKEIINQIFENKNKDKIQIKFLNDEISLSEISCEYDIAFGMLSSSLCNLKSECKKIKVYCLKSLCVDAIEEKREEYFLKLFNEDIIFYDDYKNQIDENVKKFDKHVQDIERLKFSDFLKNL